MQGVVERGSSLVEVAAMADPICAACPSLQPDGQSFEFQASVMRRDQALLGAMGWRPGLVLNLEEAFFAVMARREELMADVCGGCEWLPRCREKGPNGIASPNARGLTPPEA